MAQSSKVNCNSKPVLIACSQKVGLGEGYLEGKPLQVLLDSAWHANCGFCLKLGSAVSAILSLRSKLVNSHQDRRSARCLAKCYIELCWLHRSFQKHAYCAYLVLPQDCSFHTLLALDLTMLCTHNTFWENYTPNCFFILFANHSISFSTVCLLEKNSPTADKCAGKLLQLCHTYLYVYIVSHWTVNTLIDYQYYGSFSTTVRFTRNIVNMKN